MVDRVDRERRVRQRHRGQTEAPHEPWKPAHRVHCDRKQQRRKEVVLVEEAYFGILREVPHDRVGRVDLLVFIVQEPPDVRVVEPAHLRAVRVAVAVRELVVIDVVTRPPERPLLHRGHAEERPAKPRDAVHLEGAVRVIAMKRERQSDGPGEVRNGPERDVAPRKRHREHEQRPKPGRARRSRSQRSMQSRVAPAGGKRARGNERGVAEVDGKRQGSRERSAEESRPVSRQAASQDASPLLRTLLLRAAPAGSRDAGPPGSRTQRRSRTCRCIAQATPFSSTTTVTGLPSTPSRNERRQPQASRACVKPLSMWASCRSTDRRGLEGPTAPAHAAPSGDLTTGAL